MADLTTEERLDRQAAAIKRLRKDRDDLKARVEMLEILIGAQMMGRGHSEDESVSEASDTAQSVVPLVAQGTWVHRADCLVCGAPKGAGRRALTCAPCGAARAAAVRGEAPRPVIPACLNCGTEHGSGRGMQYLCAPCRTAAKQAGF